MFNKRSFALVCVAMLFLSNSISAQEEGFRSLFNGTDLDGWVRVNTAESTWSVKDGMLLCTGKPIGELRTTKMYQNFIMEVEWRHMVRGGNAGIFVWADDITARGVPFHRSIEVQVLENDYGNSESHTTHGDIFPIHGASMTPVNGRGGSRAFPTENRSKPSPEWNHYRIECRDGEISLAVNGKIVTRGTDCSPRKGYICIESEGGVVHYRNMRIKELPDTEIAAEQIAVANRDFRSLYNGIDLEDWQKTGAWKPQDWVLSYAGKEPGTLITHETFADVGFVFDLKRPDDQASAAVTIRGAKIEVGPGNEAIREHLVKGWNRFEGELRGRNLTLSINGKQVKELKDATQATAGPLQLDGAQGVDFANIYVRKLSE
jgi:hypothetical protein